MKLWKWYRTNSGCRTWQQTVATGLWATLQVCHCTDTMVNSNLVHLQHVTVHCGMRHASSNSKKINTRMWANAQPDGRPAEHRWRPLFNAAKFGW